MVMPALASTEDLEARMGQVDDVTQAQARLDDASALIRAEASEVSDEQWLDPLEVPQVIVTVCCKVAQRALTNPEMLASESIESFQAAYREGSGDAYLTRKEARIVRRAAGGSSFGSIGLESPYPPSNQPVYPRGYNPPMLP